MKLLFSIKSLGVRGGGAERVLVDLLNGLARRNRDSAVLTFDFPGPTFYPLDPAVPHYQMAFSPAGRPIRMVPFVCAVPRIRRTIRLIGPEAIIAFMHSTYVPLAIAAAGLGIPMIVSEHTVAGHYASRPMQRWLRELVDRRAFARTVPSLATLAGHGADPAVRTEVIPNPIDTAPFARAARAAPASPPVLLSVGGMRIEKDHLTLIRAFSEVAPSFPGWRLRIVGEGVLRGKLESAVAHLGLRHRIELPGATDRVAAEYADSAIVAIPSRYESFPMVAAEALASCRPVIAFDTCAGVAEFVRDGVNGLLVPGAGSDEARVASLADGMRRLMGDADLRRRLGAAGPEAVSRFGLEPVLDQWEQLLAEVAGGD